MTKRLNYIVNPFAAYGESLEKFNRMTTLEPHRISMEDKRIAILQRNIYLKGVKVLHKQERLGQLVALFISVSLIVMLFFITR
jgi:hypothetical protein